MKYHHLIAWVLCFGDCASTLAQSDSVFLFKKTLPGNFVDFTVDNLGNVYELNMSGQLKKTGPDGDSLAIYNDVTHYGKISYVDVTNPLKVLLYYRDFGTVVILDRFLNKVSNIDLRKQGLFQVRAIGQSYDNNVWVYDELDSKLKRIDENGRTVDQSTDFKLLFDSIPVPEFIVDQNKLVYLYDENKGVYIFDYYGAFKNRIRFTGWIDFTVIGNILLGRDGSSLYKYEPGTLHIQQYSIPPAMKKAIKIKVLPSNLYVLREGGIDVYAYR
jgi:hypothetical protein